MSAADELRKAADTLRVRAEVAAQVATWLDQEQEQGSALGDEYIDDAAIMTARLVNGGAA